MKRIALLLAILPGSAVAQDWWQGIWAWDTAWCAAAGQIGEVTPAPIEINQSEIRGYENSCAIRTTREAPNLNAVFLSLTCSGEGETYDDARLIMRGEDSIWIWFGADEPLQFHACSGKN